MIPVFETSYYIVGFISQELGTLEIMSHTSWYITNLRFVGMTDIHSHWSIKNRLLHLRRYTFTKVAQFPQSAQRLDYDQRHVSQLSRYVTRVRNFPRVTWFQRSDAPSPNIHVRALPFSLYRQEISCNRIAIIPSRYINNLCRYVYMHRKISCYNTRVVVPTTRR